MKKNNNSQGAEYALLPVTAGRAMALATVPTSDVLSQSVEPGAGRRLF
ncbi:hypothetical protein LNP74_20645 [Klebsiella pneumoniae subsp. pneumoniae]|nr:hypothetical protein [Klebsiella pneumoniae subsp. pneumoniae]